MPRIALIHALAHSVAEATIAASVATARLCLDAIAALFEGPFMVGAQITLADLHAYPMLRFLSLAPEGRDLLAEQPALAQWLQTMLCRLERGPHRHGVRGDDVTSTWLGLPAAPFHCFACLKSA